MRFRYALFFLAPTVLLAAAPAFARGGTTKQTKKELKASQLASVEAREREARKACLEGDYAKGVSILSELFLDIGDATYVFNQGRCYQQNERYREAIARFREYLRVGTEDLASAQKHIVECETLQNLENSSPPSPVAQPAVQPVASPLPVAVQPEPEVVVQPLRPTSSGSGLRTAGVVIAGVGVVALATGVGLNVKANSLASSIEPPNTYNRGTESSRKNYETFSWACYAVGAAGMVAGAILYGVGWSKRNSTGDVAVVPAIGPDLAAAALRGSF
jgi:hypothetical protein